MKWILLLLFPATITFANVDSTQNEWKVYFFVSEKCPICQYYTKKIDQIASDYENYEVVLVFPNQLSTEESVAEFQKKYELKCTTVIDSNHTLVDEYDALVTPEVILFNTSEDSVYYQGRIDDNYYRVGKRRTKVRSDDLINAIIATTNNTIIANRKTDAIGCYISKQTEL